MSQPTATGAQSQSGTEARTSSGVAKLPILDGYRAYAILAIVCIHVLGLSGALEATRDATPSLIIWAILANSIDAFFIITGYVLFLPTVARRGDFGASGPDRPVYAAADKEIGVEQVGGHLQEGQMRRDAGDSRRAVRQARGHIGEQEHHECEDDPVRGGEARGPVDREHALRDCRLLSGASRSRPRVLPASGCRPRRRRPVHLRVEVGGEPLRAFLRGPWGRHRAGVGRAARGERPAPWMGLFILRSG